MITYTDLGLFSYLGNELFQYAAMLGVGERHGHEVLLPPASQYSMGSLIEVDTPTYTTDDLKRLRHRFSQVYPYFGYEPELEKIPDWCDLNGYFQSRRHFPTDLRERFRIRADVQAEVEQIWDGLGVTKPVVGMHVRRGDIIDDGHRLALDEEGYYERAKNVFADQSVHYLFVSDDLEWCHEHLGGPDTIIAPPASGPVHLALLARCDHVVIGNSTFSWWAAWFQEPRGGTVVAPRQWFHPGTFDNDEPDLSPDWILV